MRKHEPSKGIRIDVTSDSSMDSQCRVILKEAAKAALEKHGVRAATICIAIVDDAQIEKLNRQHLVHEGPTDVLTFDLSEESATTRHTNGDGGRRIDVEIVISRDTAAREALARGHSVEAELALYAVHGTLHLLGYDDCEDAGSARMHAMEDEILNSIGIGAVFSRNAAASDDNSHQAARKRE